MRTRTLRALFGLVGLRWLVASRVSRPGSIEYRSVYKPARAKEHHLRLLAVSAANDRPSALERARASAPLPRGGSANGQTGLHARPSLPSSFSLSLSLSLSLFLFFSPPSPRKDSFKQSPLSLSSSLLPSFFSIRAQPDRGVRSLPIHRPNYC